jgi:hypothetical protein
LPDEVKVLDVGDVAVVVDVRGCSDESDFRDRSSFANPYSEQKKVVQNSK